MLDRPRLLRHSRDSRIEVTGGQTRTSRVDFRGGATSIGGHHVRGRARSGDRRATAEVVFSAFSKLIDEGGLGDLFYIVEILGHDSLLWWLESGGLMTRLSAADRKAAGCHIVMVALIVGLLLQKDDRSNRVPADSVDPL